jgi:hypothetical protein
MSVPKSERSESQMEFLHQLRDLEVKIMRLISSKPKKFQYFLNNHVLSHTVNAYSSAKAGNTIYAVTDEDVKLRRSYIYKAYCEIAELASQIEVFYEVYKSDGLTNNQIQDLSEHINLCRKLIKGVLQKDRETAKKILEKSK